MHTLMPNVTHARPCEGCAQRGLTRSKVDQPSFSQCGLGRRELASARVRIRVRVRFRVIIGMAIRARVRGRVIIVVRIRIRVRMSLARERLALVVIYQNCVASQILSRSHRTHPTTSNHLILEFQHTHNVSQDT